MTNGGHFGSYIYCYRVVSVLPAQEDPMNKDVHRTRNLGVRTAEDFVNKFDILCERLGHNRSEVVRYCLKKFFNEHWNNPENFSRVKKEMF